MGCFLSIVYDAPSWALVEKPSGMLSVPGRGPEKKDSVAYRFRHCYPDSIVQPAVHRLDMATSGLLLLAKTKESHRNLSIQFQNRDVKKEYEALLDGVPSTRSGRIELPFRLDPENRPRQVYDPVYGKWGVTRWYLRGVESGRARVCFIPETGRTHQLRLHAAHEHGLGIPIVGDFLYGRGVNTHSLLLHATKLAFTDPDSGVWRSFSSPVPF
ncbi:RluA family pseudouridine synthase [Chitinivibrio alkaliphilus]|uniref:23S RNA-specific pseudouridylate synthase n=1 Tax=Chitinivibrio alkaliphilus ACht1 TaxID=1313304 RepID=U7DEA3_9BACT|nr:RluA family pseudouridine synthase [Chitinivibrio alkaliphilus]ERP39251.1 23S RNA-specific pseudouridylate synthase [Chitinivibrio alkaliphilus ACht1]